MTERLSAGDPAPAFELTDADGNQVKLSDYAGRRVVVYFYPPAAMTPPGCTTQAIDFTASIGEFGAAGLDIIGISPPDAPPEKLARFRDKQNIAFPLLSDPEKQTLRAYGAFGGEKKLYGKVVEGVIRSTFVVDVAADGTGTIEVAQYNVKAPARQPAAPRSGLLNALRAGPTAGPTLVPLLGRSGGIGRHAGFRFLCACA